MAAMAMSDLLWLDLGENDEHAILEQSEDTKTSGTRGTTVDPALELTEARSS